MSGRDENTSSRNRRHLMKREIGKTRQWLGGSDSALAHLVGVEGFFAMRLRTFRKGGGKWTLLPPFTFLFPLCPFPRGLGRSERRRKAESNPAVAAWEDKVHCNSRQQIRNWGRGGGALYRWNIAVILQMRNRNVISRLKRPETGDLPTLTKIAGYEGGIPRQIWKAEGEGAPKLFRLAARLDRFGGPVNGATK